MMASFITLIIAISCITEPATFKWDNKKANSKTEILSPAPELTKAERKKSIDLLEGSLNKLISLTKNLSDTQLTFRPMEGRWSILDNVDHLVNVENVVMKIIEKSLQESGEGQKSDISDDEFIKKMSTREQNFNAPGSLKPQENKYNSFEDALNAFRESRMRTIDFVKKTKDDLRSHFSTNPVFGNLDVYQWTLHPAAHCYRHVEQIEEIMAHPDFPKN